MSITIPLKIKLIEENVKFNIIKCGFASFVIEITTEPLFVLNENY